MKVVQYHDCMPVSLGQPANLFPMDHPDLDNARWVRTSPVRIIERETSRGPVFVTNNTRYTPAREWKPAYRHNLQQAYA